MKGLGQIIRYLGTFVAVLLTVVAVTSLYNSLRGSIAIFEGVSIALLSVAVILLMTLYYKVDLLTRRGRR